MKKINQVSLDVPQTQSNQGGAQTPNGSQKENCELLREEVLILTAQFNKDCKDLIERGPNMTHEEIYIEESALFSRLFAILSKHFEFEQMLIKNSL